MSFDSSRITSNRKASGFTLIELLLVVAVILVLAGITFGISRGVRNAQARAQAKAELAVIAQAIEGYKLRYGDYPWHDSSGSYPSSSESLATSTMLLYALTGRMEIGRVSGTPQATKIGDSLEDSQVAANPKFLDHTKFTYTGTEVRPEALLDPWGNPYIYWYKWSNTSGDWQVFGYHLFSTGPNGDTAKSAIESEIDTRSGILTSNFRDVANEQRIIFAGE